MCVGLKADTRCEHSRASLARMSAADRASDSSQPSHAGDEEEQRSAGLADAFEHIVDALPDDWTDLELDLRIFDESRYVDAAVYLVTCNAQPYSRHDWPWRLLVAHRFGHAAAAPTVHGALKLLDDAGIEAELAVREVRSGRVDVQPMAGRAEAGRGGVARDRAQ